MSASAPLLPPNVNLTLGPMLIGVFLNTTLYGVLLVQLLLYYKHYKRDRPWFRYLVLYLFIAETVNVVFDIGLVYEPLIVRYAIPQKSSPLLLRPDAAVTVAISTPVQLFVAYRIKALTQSYLLAAPIAVLSLVSFAGGIAMTVNVSLHPKFADFDSFKPFALTWLTSTAACDVLLSAALIYSLYTRKTGPLTDIETKTDRYVDRIIRLTVQTGSVTAVAALLNVLCFQFLPHTSMNFIWDFALSKLYTNALLSTLNARPWRDEASMNQSVNVLFDEEISALPIHAAGPHISHIQFHRPRSELSTFSANRNTLDLESGIHSENTKTPNIEIHTSGMHSPLDFHRRRPELSTASENHGREDLDSGRDFPKIYPL
ncbi:hypothetical protein C8R43DRAFT_975882 [Mycena crocata]|nr:hypothetical protein C8R43DRAFT_975882 [Mycena crocata]